MDKMPQAYSSRTILVGGTAKILVIQVAAVLVLITCFTANELTESPPSAEDQSVPSKLLDKKLFDFLNDFSSIETLRRAYEEAVESTTITFKPVNGGEVLKEIASSLSDLLAKKVEALKAAVDHAEEIASEYEWNSDLTVDDVEYLHAKELNTSAEPFVFDSAYDRKINTDNSSVHIPVDIFKGDVDILNTITWTGGLDKIWKKNKEKNHSLVWQHFGSQTGVLRTYPASQWRNKTVVDLYDVRRSPWYTQGASSPKEMLILIERSGSAHGQALELIKHSVRSIIDTLGENDFVNVAQFSDKVSHSGCFHSFVQATDRNKKKLKSFLKEMTASQVANYTLGFEFAFQQFLNYSNSTGSSTSEGAGCNRIIMLFTDGTSDVPTKIFQKYNPDKAIRVFSFAVGPSAGNLSVNTKQIGCSNRGYFYPIPAMAAIRSKVQDYLTYLSGGINAYGVLSTTWSNIHEDIWEMGLVVSVTMPVFKKSSEPGNQTMLGVMGVDVTIEELMDVVPQDKLGRNGYAFAIDSNGVVLFHPELKANDEGILNPVIDFAEIEEETTSREMIRKEMIDQVTNVVEVTDFVVALDKHHIDKRRQIYHYMPIEGTDFSVAVVLPDYTKSYMEIGAQIDLDIGKHLLLTNDSKITFDYKEYCEKPCVELETNESSYTIEFSLESFVETLSHCLKNCNENLVQRLLFDVNVTSLLEKSWKDSELSEQEKNKLDSDETENEVKESHNMTELLRNLSMFGEKAPSLVNDGIISRFVVTSTNFNRVYYSQHQSVNVSVDDAHMNELIEKMYRRNLDNDVWMFASRLKSNFENHTEPGIIVATKAVSLKVQNYTAAVIGLRLSPQKLHDLLFNDVSGPCGLPDANACYVLDDGGVVMSSNQENFEQSVGKFFGVVDEEVMRDLVNNSVFKRSVKIDYQHICEEKRAKSSGFRIMPPFVYEILSFKWWTTAATWSYLNLLNLYCWFFTQVPQYEAAAEENIQWQCIMEDDQYHLNVDKFYGQLECDNCTRSYSVSRLPSTNLVVVSINGEKCDCEGGKMPYVSKELPYDPIINEGFPGQKCNVTVRYRRRPLCYDNNPHEPQSYCRASSLIMVSRLHVIVLLSFVFARVFLWLQHKYH